MKQNEEPSVLMRPAPLWSWNDKLEPDELRRQIREMVAQGWGGFFMHPRVGYTTHYLSPKWMEAVHACIDEARKLGVKAWIYDEDRWPSGYGGGVVAEIDPAYRCRAMVIRPKGTERANDRVIQEVDVRGVPYVIGEQVSELGREWFNGSTYPDLMNADAMRAFPDKVLEPYKQACGEDFGGVVPGVFTDEPLYLDNSAIDALGVPWSTKLPEFFRRLKGYDIQEHLPKLFLDQGDYRRIRFDFYDVASRLFRESFTKQYYQWCDSNGLIFTGHFQAEDSLRLQAQWTGDVMAHYPHMHWPGIDQLERKVSEVILVKQLTSVTDQLDKPRAFCECFGISGAQVSFFHRKWIGDWLIGLGINFINVHLSHYALRGPRKRDCPPNIGYQAPWWPDERGLSDHFSRLCETMTGGKRRVEVLMLQPLSSVWCDYSPMQWDSQYAPVSIYEKPYHDMAQRLLVAQIDFHIGNETILADHGSTAGSELRVGQQSYRIVVIPPTVNIRRSTLSLLVKFLAGGGHVIVTGPMPSHVDGIPAAVELPGARHAVRVVEAIEQIGRLVGDRVRAIDLRTGKPASDVIVHSRDFGSGSRHLLVNTAEGRSVDLRIELPVGDRANVAILDSTTGSTHRAPLDGDGTVPLQLAPAGSIVLLTGGPAPKEETVPSLIGSGAILGTQSGKKIAGLNRFEVELLEDNILRVDQVELEVGDRQFTGPVCAAWAHFLAVDDGTPFKATYRFHAACDVHECSAIIDSAEHLDAITFNGAAVQPLRRAGDPLLFDAAKSWKDIALTRVPLPRIQAGVNTLVIEGRKINVAKPSGISHRRTRPGPEPRETQVEDLLIAGPFTLRQTGPGEYEITAPQPMSCENLTACGAPFYAGRAKFKGTVHLTETSHSAWLLLHGMEAASARVRVNGRECGTIRWHPHAVDVGSAIRPGVNEVEIELATTMYNVIGPTHHEDSRSLRRVGPRQYVDMARYHAEHDLAPFGLKGATLVHDGKEERS